MRNMKPFLQVLHTIVNTSSVIIFGEYTHDFNKCRCSPSNNYIDSVTKVS